MIIDFHTHTFPDKIAAKTIHNLAGVSHSKPFTDGRISSLRESMAEAGIEYSVNLPVATRPDQVEKLNHQLAESFDSLKNQGIISLGCMHPDYPDYKKELRYLKDRGVPGIKLHPAYQGRDLDDIRMMRIIDAASALDMIVLAHAGIDIGILDHNYASVKHVLKVMDEVRPGRLVLAHMGGWGCWDQVESDLAGADLWLDTAFSIGPVIPLEGDPVPPCQDYNLTDEAFIRLSRKHGMDRILFATDSPWASQQDYVTRINQMPLSQEERDMVFSGNAVKLLDQVFKEDGS